MFKQFYHTNLSREHGIRETHELISNESISLSGSKKAVSLWFCPKAWIAKLQMHISMKPVCFTKPVKEAFRAQRRRLHDIWVIVGKSTGLNERLLSITKLENPSCPVFQSPIKNSMSLKTFKMRLTISCVEGKTDRIS